MTVRELEAALAIFADKDLEVALYINEDYATLERVINISPGDVYTKGAEPADFGIMSNHILLVSSVDSYISFNGIE